MILTKSTLYLLYLQANNFYELGSSSIVKNKKGLVPLLFRILESQWHALLTSVASNFPTFYKTKEQYFPVTILQRFRTLIFPNSKGLANSTVTEIEVFPILSITYSFLGN